MLKKKPFERYRLEEEAIDIVNVRMNLEDRDILNKFKELIHNPQDSTALKLALYYASNVLQAEFKGAIKLQLSKRRVVKD